MLRRRSRRIVYTRRSWRKLCDSLRRLNELMYIKCRVSNVEDPWMLADLYSSVWLTCLSAAWSRKRRDWTTPTPLHFCNGCVLVQPPCGQLAIRQTDPYHIFTRLLATLPPIPTRLRG